jgi:hypothetical protein
MTLLWSNAQGSVLVAESSHLNGQKVSGYHIFSSSDSKIITIPGAPQAGPFGYYVAF